MESQLSPEARVDGDCHGDLGNENNCPLLRVVPRDVIHASQSGEVSFQIHNSSGQFVSYKVFVKATSVDQDHARLLGAAPTNGVLKPFQSQMVRVGIAAGCVPEVCKLLLQAKVARLGEVDTFGKGDISVWDFENEQPEEYELEILVPPKQANPSTAKYESSSAGVLENIRDLLADNEQLKWQLEDLEHRHQDNVRALSEAREEIDESKIKTMFATCLFKQLEELKSSKESLEEEMNMAKLQVAERQDRLTESDVLLQTLRRENEHLSKENFLLRQRQAMSKTSITDDNLYQHLRIPRSNQGYTTAPDLYHPSSTSGNYFNMEAAGSWRMKSSPSTPSDSLMTTSSEKRNLFICEEKNLLFFLQSMTIFLAGLTLLAACNILVTDLTS